VGSETCLFARPNISKKKVSKNLPHPAVPDVPPLDSQKLQIVSSALRHVMCLLKIIIIIVRIERWRHLYERTTCQLPADVEQLDGLLGHLRRKLVMRQARLKKKQNS